MSMMSQIAMGYLSYFDDPMVRIEGGVAFARYIKRQEFNFSFESLAAVDALLDVIHSKEGPDIERFGEDQAVVNFVLLMGFYVVGVISNITDVAPSLLSQEEFAQEMPDLANGLMRNSFTTTITVQHAGVIFWPLESILTRLFEGPEEKSVQFSTRGHLDAYQKAFDKMLEETIRSVVAQRDDEESGGFVFAFDQDMLNDDPAPLWNEAERKNRLKIPEQYKTIMKGCSVVAGSYDYMRPLCFDEGYEFGIQQMLPLTEQGGKANEPLSSVLAKHRDLLAACIVPGGIPFARGRLFCGIGKPGNAKRPAGYEAILVFCQDSVRALSLDGEWDLLVARNFADMTKMMEAYGRG